MSAKRILILTADAGFGHRRAAEALAAAFRESYGEACKVSIVNPLEEASAPEIIRQLEKGYDEMVVETPSLYEISYEALDLPVVSDLVRSITAQMLDKVMYQLISEHRPNVIACTYPFYAEPAAAAIKQIQGDIPLAVVITDLTNVQSVWYSNAATILFAPTELIREQAYKNKIPATRVRVTGIPIHPDFPAETRSADELRKELGWETNLPTCLIVASERTREMASISRLLDQSGLKLQLAIVCGGSDALHSRLSETKWQNPVQLYNWVDNMPQMMKASDFIISKAGGLIVSESLACGLPMLLTEALPGQETGNVRYIVENSAGAWAASPPEVLAPVYAWLKDDCARLEEVQTHARALGRPEAAFEIARVLWGLAI